MPCSIPSPVFDSKDPSAGNLWWKETKFVQWVKTITTVVCEWATLPTNNMKVNRGLHHPIPQGTKSANLWNIRKYPSILSLLRLPSGNQTWQLKISSIYIYIMKVSIWNPSINGGFSIGYFRLIWFSIHIPSRWAYPMFFSAEHSRASDCPTRTHPTSCPLAHRNRQEQSGDDHPKVVENKQCLKATLSFTGEYPVNLC